MRTVRLAFALEFLELAKIVGLGGVIGAVGHVLHAGHAVAGGLVHGGFHGAVFFFRRWRRHDALDQSGGGVFEDAGGIAVLVAVNFAAGRVGGIAIDAGQLEGKRIGERHVAVDAPEEGGMIAAGGVDELAIGQNGEDSSSDGPRRRRGSRRPREEFWRSGRCGRGNRPGWWSRGAVQR